MNPILRCTLTLAVLALPLAGGELPVPAAAKLLALISRGAGENGRITCKNAEMVAELGKIGSEVNAASRVAWATTAEEVRMFTLQRKCVVANDPKFLSAGAGVVICEDGGKPKLMLNTRAISASGVTLSDQIVKAALSQQ
jgi:hypothetical protein